MNILLAVMKCCMLIVGSYEIIWWIVISGIRFLMAVFFMSPGEFNLHGLECPHPVHSDIFFIKIQRIDVKFEP